MLNKRLIIFSIFLVLLLSVSPVIAADNSTEDIVSVEETINEAVSVSTDLNNINYSNLCQVNEEYNNNFIYEDNNLSLLNKSCSDISANSSYYIYDENYKTSILTYSENYDKLSGDDWIYVGTQSSQGFPSNVGVYVQENGIGFSLKDSFTNCERQFVYKNGKYYPQCFNEKYYLPSIFNTEDYTYSLCGDRDGEWYYKRIPKVYAKSASILVEDYDFLTNMYGPLVGTGEQYSSINIPIAVFSQGDYARGGVVVTDETGFTVGTASLNYNSPTTVNIKLSLAGKHKYKVQFNSADTDHVSSTYTYFYITSIESRAEIYVNGFEEGDCITSLAGSKIKLDIYVVGASEGYIGVSLRDSNGKQLYAADSLNPVWKMNPYGLGGHINEFTVNLPEEAGNYKILVVYGMKTPFHELRYDYVTSKVFNLTIIDTRKITYVVSAVSAIDNQITRKQGSILDLDINVTKMVNPVQVFKDDWDQFRIKEPKIVNEGYVCVVFNGNEYKFPVVNSIANVKFLLNNTYYNGKLEFTYKQSELDFCGFSTSVEIKTVFFNNITLSSDHIICNSDAPISFNVSVIGDGYCDIREGVVKLSIINKNTGKYYNIIRSNVIFGNATFNVKLPKNIYNYTYYLEYSGLYSKINNLYLNVDDIRFYNMNISLIEGSKIVSSIKGKHNQNKLFKVKIEDCYNNITDVSIKIKYDNLNEIIIFGNETNNDEILFNLTLNYKNRGSALLIYYIVDGIEVLKGNYSLDISKANMLISFNESIINKKYAENKTLIGYIFDEFGNPMSGKVYSGYHNKYFTFNDGILTLSIGDKDKYGINRYSLHFYVTNYEDNSFYYKINVTKENAIIEMKNNYYSFKYGSAQSIPFNIRDSITRQLISLNNLSVNNKDCSIENVGVGKYYLKVPTTVGVYNLILSSDDYRYENISYSIVVNITKIKPVFNFNINDIYYSETAKYKVKSSKDVNGYVNIEIYDNKGLKIKSSNIFLENGTLTKELTNLNASNYTINFNYKGNNNYLPYTDSTIFKVYPKSVKLNLNVIDTVQGKNLVVNITSTGKGNALVKAGNNIVNVVVNPNTLTSVNLGILSVGIYDVVVEFNGGNNYINNVISKKVKILSKIDERNMEISVPEIKVNQQNNILIKLPEDASGIVTLNVGGTSNNFVVKDGKVSVKVPELSEGNYYYTITYSGDNKYASFTNSGSWEVTKILATAITSDPVVTVYNGGKYLVITLKDETGKAIKDVQLVVVLNGKTYTPITDSKGQVKVSTNSLAPKTYTAKITFKGNTSYNKATKSVKVTVKKATPKLTAKAKTFKKSIKTKKYTVTLKNNKNKALKKVKLSLKVKGKTYYATTNKYGKATFKITKLTKKGKYTATLKFKGSKYYTAKTVKPKITIK